MYWGVYHYISEVSTLERDAYCDTENSIESLLYPGVLLEPFPIFFSHTWIAAFAIVPSSFEYNTTFIQKAQNWKLLSCSNWRHHDMKVANGLCPHERVIIGVYQYKHQHNIRVLHEGAYIVCFLTRHYTFINDEKCGVLYISTCCLTRSVYFRRLNNPLLMASKML